MPRKHVRPIPEPLLTIREVAGWLRIHTNTVRRLADSGALKTYRVGLRRDRRFSIREVERYLNWRAIEIPTHYNEDRLLSLQETSLRLGVHVNTLRRWADRDELRATRIGSLGERQFSEQEVERYLESRGSPDSRGRRDTSYAGDAPESSDRPG